MVELPRYVRRFTKPNGRSYVWYHEYRGTPRAWPPVPLPTSTLSEEFMIRLKQCERLSAERGEAGWSWGFVDLAGRSHAVPDPSDAGFWAAVDKIDQAASRALAGDAKTFGALIATYKEHDAWTALSDGSREGYRIYLDAIERAWGEQPVSALTPVDVQQAIDHGYKGTPSAARYFRSVLSRLISFGIPRGYCTSNPVEHTEKPAEGGTYSPWPDWAFDLFFEHARLGLHLSVWTGLYTGQRSIDVIAMVRPGPKATEMQIVQAKTEVQVAVQMHSEYRRILDAAFPPPEKIVPLRGESPKPLHLREDGEPWTLAGWKTAWQREMTFGAVIAKQPTPEDLAVAESERQENPDKAAAMAKLRESRVVFHGLRKNAVINLLEVGCSEDEVGAIVGMSSAMVRHYGREVRKHRLAIRAMQKLEAGWAGLKLGGA